MPEFSTMVGGSSGLVSSDLGCRYNGLSVGLGQHAVEFGTTEMERAPVHGASEVGIPH